MTTRTRLSASQENYLEAIFHIVSAKRAAKPRDIAAALDVNNSSVTGALRALAEKELINYAPFEVITLTSRGKAIAQSVVRRHEALHDFLVDVLGIEEAEADQVACRMEHVVTPTTLERIMLLLNFVDTNPLGTIRWIEGEGFVQGGQRPKSGGEGEAD